MKYFLRVLLALVLAVAVVTGVYYYTNDKTLPGEAKTVELTTVTKPPATEKYAARTLIASLDKHDFRLYKSGNAVILEHGDNEFTYENWSKDIDSETPKMYYSDFDGDGKKELIIRAVSGEDENTGEFVYELYVLNPTEGDTEDYSVAVISQDTWRDILDGQVTEELSQLKYCSKILQFVMDEKSASIAYNADTGIAENGAYIGYAKALQDDNGKYMTLFGWTKSKGLFSVDKDSNSVSVEVECIANYDESHIIQDLGKIHFGLKINTDNSISVIPKSMYFKPNDKYRVNDPRVSASAPWDFMRSNSSVPKGSGTIGWAKYQITLDENVMADTVELGGEETDIKYVKEIALNQNIVTLTAFDGYTFSADPVEKGDFSVIINKGGKNEYEISYTAAISPDKKVVSIAFDNSYDQKMIKTIDISYGSR